MLNDFLYGLGLGARIGGVAMSVVFLARAVYLAGAEIANWDDETKIELVFLPLLAVLIPAVIVLLGAVIALANGWLKPDQNNATTVTTNTNNSNQGGLTRAGTDTKKA